MCATRGGGTGGEHGGGLRPWIGRRSLSMSGGGAVVQPEVGEPGTAVQPPTPAFTVPHSKSLQGSPGTTPVA